MHNERDVEAGEEGPALTAGHPRTVIAVVENDGVVGDSGSFQFLELSPDLSIHLGQLVMVLGPVFAHFGVVRMVGGHAHLGRIMNLDVGASADLAFVAHGVVEYGEERLLLVGTIFPMSFPATFIPHLTFLAQVVIFLGLICAVVPKLSEVGGIHFVAFGQAGHAAHVLGAGGRRIHA